MIPRRLMHVHKLVWASTLLCSVACGGGPSSDATNASPSTPAPAPAVAATPSNIVVQIAGGNAIVFTDGGARAVVGPVAPQAGSRTDYNDHDMDLVLVAGAVDNGPNFAPADSSYGGRPLWRAKGYDIRMCEDGTCTEANSLNAVTTPPPSSCVNGAVTNGTMYYVPNLTDLHKGSKLAADWRDRLATRLILQRGNLVTTSVVECFEFKNAAGASVRRESLADGNNGVENVFTSTAKFIDVIFSQGGKVVKTIRVSPDNGNIKLSLYPTGHGKGQPADDLKPGAAVRRFAPFYDLLDPATFKGRLTLSYMPNNTAQPKQVFVNPGAECPMISYTAP